MSLNQRRRSSVSRMTITLNTPAIKEKMNLDEVAKAVAEEDGMLTTDQLNLLFQRFTPEDERKAQLLEFVCQKGEEGMEQFLRCLRASGHTDLANSLESKADTMQGSS